jgi:hypothetical protein
MTAPRPRPRETRPARKATRLSRSSGGATLRSREGPAPRVVGSPWHGPSGPCCVGLQEIPDERRVQAHRVRQRRVINRDAIQQFRQLAQRARPLHRHRDGLTGPPAPRPEVGGQRPVLTRRDALHIPSD